MNVKVQYGPLSQMMWRTPAGLCVIISSGKPKSTTFPSVIACKLNSLATKGAQALCPTRIVKYHVNQVVVSRGKTKTVVKVLSHLGNNPNENVKLEGGETEAEGRVMIKRNGVWGSVCDDRWGQSDAAVVCRMLCYQ